MITIPKALTILLLVAVSADALNAGSPLSQQDSLRNQELVCEKLLARAEQNDRLSVQQFDDTESGTRLVYGTYRVFENRALASGRTIDLAVMVLPAWGSAREPDPVFMLHGGPGAAATSMRAMYSRNWIREQRDIVLIDQRGTGRSNPLHVRPAGGDDNLQSYFDPIFQPDLFRAALPELQKKADLTQYTTPIAVDDFNEVREALGYKQINLRGGSYGSRAALVYMRRHPQTIRTATLQAVAPIAYRNPLPHARGAQEAIDRIFDECESSPEYRKAFGNIRQKFSEILDRLQRTPAMVSVRHPQSAEDVTIRLTRDAFAESVRVLMYRTQTSRRLPALLVAAHKGDYRAIAQAGLENNRGLRRMLAFGMLMCVVGTEDISRIDPAEIDDACAGTFLGTQRVRSQMAVAEFWPRGDLPTGYGDPVKSDIPTLLFSGTLDPTTTPKWGEEAARHLSNSLHVVVPAAHGVSGREVRNLEEAFLLAGSVRDLDTSAIRAMELPPLVMPR